MDAVFHLVYSLLLWASRWSGLSYEAVNIIVYYLLVPLAFLILIDRIIKSHLCVSCFLIVWCFFLFWVPSFEDFSKAAFERSAEFLRAFSAVGWNYTVASVLICVVAPAIVFVVLFHYAFPSFFRRIRRSGNHAKADGGV